MKIFFGLFWIATAIWLPHDAVAWTGPIYLAGHADIGAEYLTGPSRLELNIRLDGDTQFSDGHDLSLQVVSPDTVAIRSPGPPLLRQHYIGDPDDPDDDYDVSGPQWDFLGADQDEPFWYLPQSNDPFKPFFGFATDGLNPADWSSPVTWSLRSIVSAPAGGEVSLWQTNFFLQPEIKYASFDGITPEEDSFDQAIPGHDHYNWGFSKPGIYEVELAAKAERAGSGTVEGSGVFTFLVGDYTSPPTPGDFNDDLLVDGDDFLLWQRSFGSVVPNGTGADGNGDGFVDGEDLPIWESNFGATYPPSSLLSVGQPVPEPSTLWLLMFAFGSVPTVSKCFFRCSLRSPRIFLP